MNPKRLDDRITLIAKRTRVSEDEVRQTIIEQADRLLGESNLALKGRSPNEIIEEARLDRRQVMAGLHTLSLSIKTLSTIASERLLLYHAATQMVCRRLGITKVLPDTPQEKTLIARGGFLNTIGRTIIPPENQEPRDRDKGEVDQTLC